MSRTTFHGPKDVRAIEVRLYLSITIHKEYYGEAFSGIIDEIFQYAVLNIIIPATWTVHYENTPIQIYRKFHLQKLTIFR